MSALMPRTTPDQQLDAIATLTAAEDEDVPIKVRLSGGYYDYEDSQWVGDRRPSYYLGFVGIEQVQAYQRALDLFMAACTRVSLADLEAALQSLIGDDNG